MPHGDAFSHQQPAAGFLKRDDISESTRQKLLRDNARNLYQF
jgi:hypothetical protein